MLYNVVQRGALSMETRLAVEPMKNDVDLISGNKAFIDSITTHRILNDAELAECAYSVDTIRGAKPIDGRASYSQEFVSSDKMRMRYEQLLDRFAEYTRYGHDLVRLLADLPRMVSEYERESGHRLKLSSWRAIYQQLLIASKSPRFEPLWHMRYRGDDERMRSQKAWDDLVKAYSSKKIAVKGLDKKARDKTDRIRGYHSCYDRAHAEARNSYREDDGMSDYEIDALVNGYDVMKRREREDADDLMGLLSMADPFSRR